jgi:hypothetical protein
MHAAILTTMETLDASEWDVNPIRDLLVALLGGEAFVRGDVELDLQRAERAGVLEFRHAEDHELRSRPSAWRMLPGHPVWVVEPTLAGTHLALRIAHSQELIRVIDVHEEVGVAWRGVDVRDAFNELDLRDGGPGRVTDWRAWGETRGRFYLSELPRRGLDAQATPQD